jgi:hypothetical protein
MQGGLFNPFFGINSVSYSSDATTFFTRLAALGDVPSNAYKALFDALYIDINATLGRDNINVIKNGFAALWMQPISKISALQNMIADLFNGVISNDYAGSFVQGEGLKGNGSNFSVNRGFNPASPGSAKFLQNSACAGFLCLDDVAENSHDLGGLSSGSNGSYLKVRDISGSNFGALGSINGPVATTTYPTNPSARCWVHIERTSSASLRIYINGFRVFDLSNVSTSLANVTFVEFAATVAGTLSLFSSKTHAVCYIGNGNIEQNTIMKVINRSFLYPLGNSRSAIKNRVLFLGDSMTGDETVANKALSVNSRIAIRTLANMGSDWLGAVNGDANREIVASTTVPGLLSGSPTILQIQVIGTVAGAQQTFRNDALTKDVISSFIGTNDNAFHAVTDSAAMYAGVVSMGNTIKGAGFKHIFTGMVARDGGYQNSQTTVNWNLANADFRTRMALIFNVPTAVPNVYAPNVDSFADLWIDIYADAAFQNASDTTYFQADKVHLNQTGFDRYSDVYLSPALAIV